MAVASPPATATDFTASVVMTEMEPSDRFPFVAGIVEGLSYARYMQDGEKTEGMECIYNWFYQTEDRISEVYASFEKFPDFLAGAVVAAMVQKECGAT